MITLKKHVDIDVYPAIWHMYEVLKEFNDFHNLRSNMDTHTIAFRLGRSTGQTRAAIKLARTFLEQGKNVVLVCRSQSMVDHLKRDHQDLEKILKSPCKRHQMDVQYRGVGEEALPDVVIFDALTPPDLEESMSCYGYANSLREKEAYYFQIGC